MRRLRDIEAQAQQEALLRRINDRIRRLELLQTVGFIGAVDGTDVASLGTPLVQSLGFTHNDGEHHMFHPARGTWTQVGETYQPNFEFIAATSKTNLGTPEDPDGGTVAFGIGFVTTIGVEYGFWVFYTSFGWRPMNHYA